MALRLRVISYGALFIWCINILYASDFSVEDQRTFADGLYSRGLHKMALKEYRSLVSRLPPNDSSPIIYFRMGECARAMGAQREAIRYYLVAAGERDPETETRARIRLGQLYLKNNAPEEAINQLEKLTLSPGNTTNAMHDAAYYYLAKALGEQADQEQQIQTLKTLVDQFPNSAYLPFASIELASIYAQKKINVDEQIRLLTLALQTTSSDKLGAQATYRLAETYFASGDMKNAEATYRQLQMKYPKDPLSASVQLKGAWASLKSNQPKTGLSWVPQHIEQQENPDQWWYLKANFLRKNGQQEEALFAYKKLLDEFPASPVAPNAVYEYALLATENDRFDAIIEQADRLMQHETYQAEAVYLLAEAHRAEGDLNQAIRFYQLYLDEHQGGDQKANALLNLATLYQQESQWQRAEQKYSTFVHNFPKDPRVPQALMAAAFCSLEDGQPEKAVAAWKQVVQLGSNSEQSEEAQYRLSMYYVKQQQKEVAKNNLLLFLKDFPESARKAEVLYWLATLYQNEGNLEQASLYFEQMNQLNDTELNKRALLQQGMIAYQQEDVARAATLLEAGLQQTQEPLPATLCLWLLRYKHQEKDTANLDTLYQIMAPWIPRWEEGQQAVAYALLNQPERLLPLKVATPEGAETLTTWAERISTNNPQQAQKVLEKAGTWASALERTDLQARVYFTLGILAELNGDKQRAARHYMGMGMLFDDPVKSPTSLLRAARLYDELGEVEAANEARNEHQRRYAPATSTP